METVTKINSGPKRISMRKSFLEGEALFPPVDFHCRNMTLCSLHIYTFSSQHTLHTNIDISAASIHTAINQHRLNPDIPPRYAPETAAISSKRALAAIGIRAFAMRS